MSQVLALKYRPKLFSDLIGQQSVSKTLSLALNSNRISNAYLFSGLRGSGKTSSARIFARSLQCEKGPTSEPCGECANCISALEGRHLDIIEMDGASNRKIDDVRELIEQTKYYPSMGRYKIFIIDEVHMLTREAFNALLKTLEEPPEFVKFILATTDPLKLPATILSRTQHFRFKQISRHLVIEHLAHILKLEKIDYEPKVLEILARAGGGSLRDTLTLLDQAIIFCQNNINVGEITQMLGIIDPLVFEDFFNNLLSNAELDFNKQLEIFGEYDCEMVLDEMTIFLKNRLVAKDTSYPPLILDRFFRIIASSKSLLNLNSDTGFVLLLTFMKMKESLKICTIDEMIKNLEKKIYGQDILLKQNKHSSATQNTDAIAAPNSNMSSARDSMNLANTEELKISPSTPQELFKKLINKIYDRNFELGETFEKSIQFIKLENKELHWISNAEGTHKQILKEHYKIIATFVKEIFGEVKICAQKNSEIACSTESEKIPSSIDSNPTQNTQDIQDMGAQKYPNKEHQNEEDTSPKDFIARNKDLISSIRDNLGIKDIIQQKKGRE